MQADKTYIGKKCNTSFNFKEIKYLLRHIRKNQRINDDTKVSLLIVYINFNLC